MSFTIPEVQIRIGTEGDLFGGGKNVNLNVSKLQSEFLGSPNTVR